MSWNIDGKKNMEKLQTARNSILYSLFHSGLCKGFFSPQDVNLKPSSFIFFAIWKSLKKNKKILHLQVRMQDNFMNYLIPE